jgi:hypothetical protein
MLYWHNPVGVKGGTSMRTFRFLSAFLLLIVAACSNNTPGRDTGTACQDGGIACHGAQQRGGEGMGRGGIGGGGMGGGMGM